MSKKEMNLLEHTPNCLTFIDIDETLFFNHGKIKVVDKETKEVLTELNNKEFNTHDLKSNEEYDYSDFLSSDIFIDSSVPNIKMIEKLQDIFANTKVTNSELYVLTARPDLDDKDKFLNFLISHGIEAGHKDNGKIHILRAGNEEGDGSAEKKRKVIKRMLDIDHEFNTVVMYDDAVVNLDMLIDLKNEYPNLNFETFLIDHLEILLYKGIK